ncbi:MAG TPA: DUF4396 domain-containing protein [Gaiellaceae bacterium]|nr:DUF4396 domain-containing protein [Gaiellaceae bacterium]
MPWPRATREKPRPKVASCSKRSSDSLKPVRRPMEAHAHERLDDHGHQHGGGSLTRTAIQATLHCLTGCAIGEVLGMIIATALGLGNTLSIVISITLAFFFGYGLTLRPVLGAGIPLRRAAGLAFASDTLSITTMEIVDNAFILLVPGAIAAGLSDSLFWWSLAVSLVIAFMAAVPVNRYLIARGRGHAVMHEFHHH